MVMTDFEPDVRRIRAGLGLTQGQFAERLGVTLLTVHRWEAGKSRPQRIARDRLRELAEALARQTAGPQAGAAAPPPAAPPELDFAGNPDAVAAVAEAWRLAYGHQFNPAFASETARIDPLPHQRVAVYERMLRQEPLRFLLADDAGAGKTIMTGLYVREMLSRGRIRRVLIVPPAGLVGNWERELRTLFGLRFRIAAGADNPFRGADGDRVIVSLDTLTGERAFTALREPAVAPYDLVVFDEAHKLSATAEGGRIRKRRRYELAEALAGCAAPESRFAGLGWAARHLLLLTATPHMGKDSPYHFLWRLLDPQVFSTGEAFRRFPPERRHRHFIRRTKEEMVGLDGGPLYRTRTCDTFSYDLSGGPDGEQALYERTTAYLTDTYGRALSNRPAVRLAMSVFQRRLASSTWALLRSLERRIEKLTRTIDDLQSGRMSAADLHRRQSGLDREFRADFFDTHGADEDAHGDGLGERSEEYEDAVLGAMTAVTVEEVRREIGRLEELSARARRLVDTGGESKFETLREMLEDPRHADEKWLIFSEHRDTVDYLIRRLEGLGFSGRIAQVHGGMSWPEREEQVERFRRPAGARYLVATDAAGEGINLQFCRLMVNYDIPWNPARLEQRMGRIHRYGQRHDVRIVNLVAGKTREGRVLCVLLDKLDAIRRDLDSDQVFDVIGRLFENASLREYLLAALTDPRGVVGRIESEVTAARVRDIGDRERTVYGAAEQGAERLGAVRNEVERERYLRLLPGYVRRLVAKAAGLLDLDIRGDLDAFFALAPRRPGALDGLLAALEAYPAAARERLCVRRPAADADGVWLHPGEPIFDALCGRILAAYGRDAQRGAIFADPRADAPYLFHLLEVSVAQESHGQPRGHRVLDRRLLGVRHGGDGAPAECDVERLLLLRGAPGVAPGAVALAGRGSAMRAEAAQYAERTVLERLVAERRDAARAELPERRRRTRVGYSLRAAELAARRVRLSDRRDRAEQDDSLAEIKREQRLISTEKEQALAGLDSASERIVPGGVRFLVHALAVPAADAEEVERYDERVEEIAVGIAVAWEQERGGRVSDVSKPERARSAGLPDWPGFDLLSRHPGEARNIEVKGRAGQGAIAMEANEWKQACHLGDSYWLYVVFDCATPRPRLVRVRDPFAKLLARSRESAVYTISAASLIDAAEQEA